MHAYMYNDFAISWLTITVNVCVSEAEIKIWTYFLCNSMITKAN